MTGIGQTKFTEHEIGELRAGRAIPNKEIVLSEKRKFTATLQINVERRGVEFVPKQNGQNQRQHSGQAARQSRSPQPAAQATTGQATTGQTTAQPEGGQKPKVYKFQWLDENGNIRAPKTMGGVLLTPEQQKDFTAGKAILVKDMKRDGKGEPYTAYVKYDFEAGKPKYFRTSPEVSQAKVVAPAMESRTQVAVNTDGKTNEATKNVREPLRQGQTQPTDGQQRQEQRRQNKPKGMSV